MSNKVWEDERITAYVLGDLSDQQLAEFESVLQSDAALQEAVDEARAITDSLGELFEAESPDVLSQQRMEAILANADSNEELSDSEAATVSLLSTDEAAPQSKTFYIESLLATAAAILLVVTVASYIRFENQSRTVANSVSERSLELRSSVKSEQSEDILSLSLDAVAVDGKPAETRSELESLAKPVVAVSDVDQTVEEFYTVQVPEQTAKPEVVIPGQPLPSPYYLKDDVRYSTAPNPEVSNLYVINESRQSTDSLRFEGKNLNGLNSRDFGLGRPGPGVGGPGPGVLPPANASTVQPTVRAKSAVASSESKKKSSTLARGSVAAQPLRQTPANAPVSELSKADKSLSLAVNEAIVKWNKPEYLTLHRYRVESGTVTLEGEIAPGARDALVRVVRGVPGVKRVEDLTRERYDNFTDNPFKRVADEALSTFSIDVDTASYSKVRMYLTQHNTLPQADAVRIEELVNYFEYDYPAADDKEQPFSASMEVTSCPWNAEHRLARIAIKGREIKNEKRPSSNLVFLLDVSGSMDKPNKLPLVKRGMQMLLDKLGENDRVSIVVYAGAAGMVLDSTSADNRQVIYDALERLKAGGSTNGGQGIQLAYQLARDHFIQGGTNRVILCTDGDFNVGKTGTGDLVSLVEKESAGGIFLSVLGFGMGNHNDEMLEKISGRGNGNYAFIDTDSEAHKVLVQQISSTLVTIAKNVKIQIEFNPLRVSGYRLIGYENRMLAKEDFNDDKKDAGEIGAGHNVTAFYEIIPAGKSQALEGTSVDDLKYQKKAKPTKAAESGELLTLKLRHMLPEAKKSTLQEFVIKDEGKAFSQASGDFQFAASVASFGMLLRNSPHKGNATFASVEETAESSKGDDAYGLREEFIKMVRKAAELSGE